MSTPHPPLKNVSNKQEIAIQSKQKLSVYLNRVKKNIIGSNPDQKPSPWRSKQQGIQE